MIRFLFITVIALSISVNGYAQEECKVPDIQATFKQKFKEIGVLHPDFLKAATIISYTSPSRIVQWAGLYWEGPISGALLAYDCAGKLLSIRQTGGIKSMQFFNLPPDVRPAIAVEEIGTGTGYYLVQYAIYSFRNGEISKLWGHRRLERLVATPSVDGFVDFFEFRTAGSFEERWKKMIVEGVRKNYPANKTGFSDFNVEKLPTEIYCWDKDKKTYVVCK